jgi:hypothetical protein
MFNYPVHTIESAPAKSQPALKGLKEIFGVVTARSRVSGAGLAGLSASVGERC